MKKIKNVQGREGRWTVTDCDADRKGERCIVSLSGGGCSLIPVQDDLLIDYALRPYAEHHRRRYRAFRARLFWIPEKIRGHVGL